MPDVTVVIPTRARRDLLSRTLSAIFNQDGADLEIIVVVDASSDGTAAMLAAIEDSRLRVLDNPTPRGVSHARNQGIEAARGEWIAFVDDDDLWAPSKLQRQLQAARDADAEWAYTGFVQVDERLHVVAGGPPPRPEVVRSRLAFENVLPAGGSSVLARRRVLREIGAFDTSLCKLEDWDLWMRLAAVGRPACVAEPLVAYVEHPGMTSLDTAELLAELERIEERYAAQRGGRPLNRVWVHRWAGWRALQAGDRRRALRAYQRAVIAGDLTSVARAAVGFISPRFGVRVARRYFDREWAACAERWLQGFRE